MKIFLVETKNGRIFKVALENKNQEKRFYEVIRKNKKKSYEKFIKVEDIETGINNIKEFEKISETLV